MSHFCPVPWLQLSSTPSGKVRPCCHMTGENVFLKHKDDFFYFQKDDFNSYWNSDQLKDIRRMFLANQQPSVCQKCWTEEEHGIESHRVKQLNKYHLNRDELHEIQDEPPKYIDLRLSNTCNLKCRTCGPFSSSKWNNDWLKIQNITQLTSDGTRYTQKELEKISSENWIKSRTAMESLNYIANNIEEVYITGGEPMLIDEHLFLLDTIIAQGRAHQVKVKYNTNVTIINHRLISRWQHFKRIRFNCSIDATNELNNYIRHPSRWSEITNNLNQLTKLNNSDLEIACTVSVFNILKLDDLFKFAEDNGIKVHLIFVHHPECYNIKILPKHLKELAIKRLNTKDYSDVVTNFNRIIPFLMGEDLSHQFKNFLKVTKALDKLRNESIQTIIPEFFN